MIEWRMLNCLGRTESSNNLGKQLAVEGSMKTSEICFELITFLQTALGVSFGVVYRVPGLLIDRLQSTRGRTICDNRFCSSLPCLRGGQSARRYFLSKDEINLYLETSSFGQFRSTSNEIIIKSDK